MSLGLKSSYMYPGLGRIMTDDALSYFRLKRGQNYVDISVAMMEVMILYCSEMEAGREET